MRRLALSLAILGGCSVATTPMAAPAPSPQGGGDLHAAVKEIVASELGSLLEAYRWFHQNAELSNKEFKTSERLAAEARKAGWTVTEKVGGTGVVAVLRNGDGPVVLARVDMDGLPVKELTGLPYASTTDAMHACGHDSHLAMGVGVLKALPRLKHRWSGTAVLIGQPAEEIGQGAKQMIADPKFAQALPGKPVACLSVHDFPTPAGSVGVCSGYASANVDGLDILVHGKGGHGAWPHETVDPIVIGSEIVLSLQTIVSRKLKPGTRAVVTVGTFNAGTKRNVIGPEAKLQLTVRSYDAETRKTLIDEIKHIAARVSEAHRAPKAAEVTFPEDPTPAGFHDPALSSRMKSVFERLLGKDRVYDSPPMMGGEDFSRFPLHFGVPGLQIAVGGAKPNHDPTIGLHSPRWAVDPEPTLQAGTSALVRGMLDLFQRE
jgi:amidohydrolase